MSYANYQKKIESGEAFRVDQGTEHLTFTRKSSRKNKLVFVALLIVLIIAIVFIVLYALQVAKSTPTTATDTPLTAACGPADCVLIASGQFFQHSLIFFHDADRLYMDMKCFGPLGRLLSALHLVLFVRGTYCPWLESPSRTV